MKKINLIVLSVFIFSLFLSANAQNKPITLDTKEIKNVNQERIQERKEERKEIKASISELRESVKLQREDAKASIEKLRETAKLQKDQNKAKLDEIKLQNRQNVLARFEQLTQLVETRKESVENYLTKASTFVNTEEAKAKLGSIEEKLLIADEKVAEISKILSTGTTSITQEQKNKLSELKTEFQNSLKSANDDLKMIVKDTREKIKAGIQNAQEIKKVEDSN